MGLDLNSEQMRELQQFLVKQKQGDQSNNYGDEEDDGQISQQVMIQEGEDDENNYNFADEG